MDLTLAYIRNVLFARRLYTWTGRSILSLAMLVEIMSAVFGDTDPGRVRSIHLLHPHTFRYSVAVANFTYIHCSMRSSQGCQIHPLELWRFLPVTSTAVTVAATRSRISAVTDGLTSAILHACQVIAHAGRILVQLGALGYLGHGCRSDCHPRILTIGHALGLTPIASRRRLC